MNPIWIVTNKAADGQVLGSANDELCALHGFQSSGPIRAEDILDIPAFTWMTSFTRHLDTSVTSRTSLRNNLSSVISFSAFFRFFLMNSPRKGGTDTCSSCLRSDVRQDRSPKTQNGHPKQSGDCPSWITTPLHAGLHGRIRLTYRFHHCNTRRANCQGFARPC